MFLKTGVISRFFVALLTCVAIEAARVELEPLGEAYAKSGWTVVQDSLPNANELVTLSFAVKLQNTARLQELFQEVRLGARKGKRK